MSIPLIALGAAGVALLYAGSKEKDAAPPTTTNATPTNQSTGGADGGATAPSHADSERFNGGTETSPGVSAGASIGLGEKMTTTTSENPDPWAPSSGPSLDTKIVNSPATATGGLVKVGQLTGKAAAQAFETLAGAAHSLAVW